MPNRGMLAGLTRPRTPNTLSSQRALNGLGTPWTLDYVASGCAWTADAAGSTLLATMTAGVVYIAGTAILVAPAIRAFTASKDTYVDVDGTGNLLYTEVANNAASPALAAGSVRLAVVVSGGSSIVAAASINQGDPRSLLPAVSSNKLAVTDSLGNRICPRHPSGGLIGYRELAADYQTTTITVTDITGLDVCAFIIPPGPARQVRARLRFRYVQSTEAAGQGFTIYLRDGGGTLADGIITNTGIAYAIQPEITYHALLAPGSYTWKASVSASAASTITIQGTASTSHSTLAVELV